MKLHVFVATTQGLVAIQNITAIDDADISSIVSINGTSTTASISSAYHNFVKNGAGIIQHDFGACSYRINIAQRIDQGNSWQLAFYLAHAAHNKALLGNGQVNLGDQVICATGEVNTTSRDVHRVEEVTLKQSLAVEQIQKWQKMNVKTSFLVPKQNAQDITNQLPINTDLIINLEQALSFLPSHTLKVKKTAIQNPVSSEQQNKNFNSKSTKSLNLENENLENKKGEKNKGEKSQLEKHKLTLASSLVILLVFIALALSFQTFFLAENKPSTEASKNANQKILSQQNWQVILLTKPQHEIKTQLQPVYSIIEKTIGEQLIAGNFEITDKALLMGTNKITEQALIELNKNEINLAIRFNLGVNKVNDAPKDTWRYVLSAYVIDLESKKQIETHNEYGEFSNELINCDQQCLSQWFADNARKLAQDMGAILTIKLKNLPRRYQFELNFQHFLIDELRLIHDQLHTLEGVKSVQLLQDFGIEQALLHQTLSRKYSYVSYVPLYELERELYKRFELLDIDVKKVNSRVSTLTFNRRNMPYYFYYLLAAVLTLSFVVFVYLARFKRKNTQSEQAIKLLIETKKLNLSLGENVNEPFMETSFNLVLSAFNNKEFYKAYSLIDKYIHYPSSSEIDNDSLKKLIEIRNNITQYIKPIKGSVVGQGALVNCYIFTSTTLEMGRSVNNPANSFSIGYKQISRSGKQCKFSREGNKFYLEDQGSTNGNFLNNNQLMVKQKVDITENSQLILGGGFEGGSNTKNIPICQLEIKVLSNKLSTLMMQLNSSVVQLFDVNGLKNIWTSMETDLISRWVLLGEEVSLSIHNDRIELGNNTEQADIIAYLVYQDGFYIRPENTVDGNAAERNKSLTINQQVVYDKMPINDNAIISINGFEFSLQRLL